MSGAEGAPSGQIEQHLMECSDCRSEIRQLEIVWSKLGTVPAAEPAFDARARFDRMVEVYRHGTQEIPSDSPWLRLNAWFGSWWVRQPALQFGLTMGLLVVGIVIGRAFMSPAPSTPVSSQSDEIVELRGELAAMREMVAMSLMQQQSAGERLRGVNWSYELQKPGEELVRALLDRLMHDENVNVRLATVDALRQFGKEPLVRKGVIEAVVREESPMVQVALIDFAVDLKEKEYLGTLKELTQNTKLNVAVRQRAQQRIQELEGF